MAIAPIALSSCFRLALFGYVDTGMVSEPGHTQSEGGCVLDRFLFLRP